MLRSGEQDLRRRLHRLELSVASILSERGFYVQVINDLVAAGSRYQDAVNAKLGQDQTTISQDEATITQDQATITQLGANALTDDEVAELQAYVGKINTAAAALETAAPIAADPVSGTPTATSLNATATGADAGNEEAVPGSDGTEQPSTGAAAVPGAADQPFSRNPGVPAGVTDQATGGVQAGAAVQAAANAAQTAGNAGDPTDPPQTAAGAAAADSQTQTGA